NRRRVKQPHMFGVGRSGLGPTGRSGGGFPAVCRQLVKLCRPPRCAVAQVVPDQYGRPEERRGGPETMVTGQCRKLPHPATGSRRGIEKVSCDEPVASADDGHTPSAIGI